MAAWVIREERLGRAAGRLPGRGDRGARAGRLRGHRARDGGGRELQQRVGGARRAGVGLRLRRPPRVGHHIGGSDASGRRVEGRRRASRSWQPGDEVVIHCNQASYEDPEVHGLDPLAAPSQQIWGYETTWGSFAQFTKVQAQQLLHKPKNLTWEEAASYGLVYFTAYRMLIDRCSAPGRPSRARLGRGRRPRRVRHPAVRDGGRAVASASSPRRRRASWSSSSAPSDYIDRNEFAGMMRKGGESPEEEKARFKESRRFSKRVAEILGEPPGHRLRARRPGDVPHLGAHGQAVRQGRHLRRDDGLQPRLRRALPVDAPEGDHRLALRQRVGVQEGQRADRAGPDPPGALAHDGASTASPRRTSSCATTSTSARSRSSSAPRRRASGKTAEGPGAIYAEVGA